MERSSTFRQTSTILSLGTLTRKSQSLTRCFLVENRIEPKIIGFCCGFMRRVGQARRRPTNIGVNNMSNAKKNPTKPRPAAVGNGPSATSPPPNRR